MELPVREVIGGSNTSEAFYSGRAREPIDTGLRHEYRDQTTRTGNVHPVCQLGMNASVSVCSPGRGVDFSDQSR